MPDGERSESKRGSFWSTLPGILTGVAAVIGSVAAVLALFTGGGDDAGKGDGQLTVPNVVDESEQTARGLIRGRELEVSRVTPVCANEQQGTVVRQKPRAGTKVERAAGVSLVVSSGERPGEITFPKEGARLPNAYTVRGRLCEIPEGSHVWLAVRTDGLYPDSELLPNREGRFRQPMTFPAPADAKGGFSHVLLLVGPSGQRAIQHWIETINYESALPGIAGERVLETVQDLKLRSVG